MGDVFIDAMVLRGITARLTGVSAEVRLSSDFADPLDDAIGSSEVSSALRDAGAEQRTRSMLAADALDALAPTPAATAAQFEAVDRQLSRVR